MKEIKYQIKKHFKRSFFIFGSIAFGSRLTFLIQWFIQLKKRPALTFIYPEKSGCLILTFSNSEKVPIKLIENGMFFGKFLSKKKKKY